MFVFSNYSYDGLDLGYQNQFLKKNSYFNNYSKQLFCQATKILFQFSL